jgi:hypothetical protein
MGQHAQKMEGLGVGRIGQEDLPVEVLGLRQIAALMMAHSLVEQLGDGRHLFTTNTNYYFGKASAAMVAT